MSMYICSIPLCIHHKYGKIRTRKTPNTDTFHAVRVIRNINIYDKNLIAQKALAIPSFPWILSHLLKKLLMEIFIFMCRECFEDLLEKKP